MNLVNDLLFNFHIFIWQDNNDGRTNKWTGLFKLLGIKVKMDKIDLISGSTQFWSTIVKSYLVNNDNIQNHFSFVIKILPFTQDLLLYTPLLFATKTLSTPITKPSQV